MSIFAKKLLEWNETENNRTMPWKGEKDPYKIWLSEIILQQTRVEQGMPYYEKFIENFPNIKSLASADDQFVFKLWEGLGYYNRCKNLLSTARNITQNKSGIFPDQYDEIISLKGIGPYTAAAIASFAFNQPYPVLDGNVFRVLSRYYGIEVPIDSTEGKKIFSELAEHSLDKNNPAKYNQAIMDFGATFCKPSTPKCMDCNLQSNCVAFQNGKVNKLPIKEKILHKKTRYFSWFLLEVNGYIYIQQRTQKDIWQNLYEFYLIETEHKPLWTSDTAKETIVDLLGVKEVADIIVYEESKQQLTHQLIKSNIVVCRLEKRPHNLKNIWIKKHHIKNYAFPKLLKDFLDQYFIIM